MQIIVADKEKRILEFGKGEEVIGAFRDYIRKENIGAGFFQALGASDDIIISYYNLDTKAFEDKQYIERLEIIGINGNIAWMDDELIIHAHGVFSDNKMSPIAGHIKKLVSSTTCEVHLTILDGRACRKFDPDTGLNLLTHV